MFSVPNELRPSNWVASRNCGSGAIAHSVHDPEPMSTPRMSDSFTMSRELRPGAKRLTQQN